MKINQLKAESEASDHNATTSNVTTFNATTSFRGREGKLPHLQVLRFLCALCVVVGHGLHNPWRTFTPRMVYTGGVLGSLGVYTFFVLSGFIIARQSSDLFGQPDSSAIFTMRRIVRIVPLYWLVTILCSFGRQPGMVGPYGLNILRSLLFVPYRSPDTGEMGIPLAGGGWTLNYEMFFYALVAVFLPFKRKVGLGGVLSILTALTLLGWIYHFKRATTIESFYANVRLLPFILGILLACFEARLPALRWPRNLPSPALLLLIPVGASILIIRRHYPITPVWVQPYGLSPIGIGLFLVVILCVMTGTGSGVSRLDRYMVKLGDASYSTYLFHLIIAFFVAKVCQGVHNNAIWLVSMVIVCHIGSWFLHIWIEKPLIRTTTRMLSAWTLKLRRCP